MWFQYGVGQCGDGATDARFVAHGFLYRSIELCKSRFVALLALFSFDLVQCHLLTAAFVISGGECCRIDPGMGVDYVHRCKVPVAFSTGVATALP